MRKEVGYFIKDVSDKKHRELTPEEIYKVFIKEYENRSDYLKVVAYSVVNNEVEITFKKGKKEETHKAIGKGVIDATIKILKDMGYKFEFINYYQESLENDKEKSDAITYINISNKKNIWAIGRDSDVVKSSLIGIISAVNKLIMEEN